MAGLALLFQSGFSTAAINTFYSKKLLETQLDINPLALKNSKNKISFHEDKIIFEFELVANALISDKLQELDFCKYKIEIPYSAIECTHTMDNMLVAGYIVNDFKLELNPIHELSKPTLIEAQKILDAQCQAIIKDFQRKNL